MSFNSNNKPKLVENKLVKYLNHKIKKKNLKDQINEIPVQPEMNVTEPKKWYKTCLCFLGNFIKENYGFVLINTLLLILLYVRYIEVSKRKEKIKKLVQQIDSTDSDNTDSEII
jgi:hypothetical protein